MAPLNSLQNGIKVRRKELDALNDDAFLDQKSKAEQALRAVAGISGPDPWQEIASASNRERALYLPYIFIENAAGFSSTLFRDARLLLRARRRTRKAQQRAPARIYGCRTAAHAARALSQRSRSIRKSNK